MGTFDDVIRMAVASYLLSGVMARVHEHGDEIFMSVFFTIASLHDVDWSTCSCQPGTVTREGSVLVS